jgi:glycosyltransferase involved in cell wall biosynthesis
MTGPMAVFRLPDASHAIVWPLMASYGAFAALFYTWLRPSSKVLLTLQEGDPLEYIAKRVGVFSFLHKKIFVRADAVQAISKFLAEWAVRMGFTKTPQVIPNGVDIQKFAKRITAEERTNIRESLGYAPSDVVIVTASRLTLKNATDDLIKSLSTLPENYHVLIAGVGEDEEMLRTLVKERKLESRVKFLGKKSHDELPALLQASDIFCRPSLSEGLGNSFLEAMAAGVPIIGTLVGGIPDFLIDGETGVACESRNPESIARAARRIQEEPGLRARLIQKGEAAVRETYDWEKIAPAIAKMLESLRT